MSNSKWIALFLLLLSPLQGFAAVTCDGTDDQFSSAVQATEFVTPTAGTIMVWVKPTGSATVDLGSSVFLGQGIVGDLGGCWGLYRATEGSDDLLQAYSLPGGATVARVTTTFTNNTWIHLAWVQTATELLLYKDGALVGSTSSVDPLIDCSGILMACRGYTSGLYFNGQMAELQIFSSILSAAEIANHAGSRLQGLLRAPGTGYWPLDQCSDGAACDGVVFADRSWNGRTLTASDGANNTGMTGKASEHLSRPWSTE